MDEIRDARNKEMFRMDDEYLNGYARICGINATGVYMSLCRHANKEQQCFPSKKLIATELAISERSVYSAIKVLEEWGILLVEHQGRKQDGSFKNLLYILRDKKYWKPKPSATGAVGNPDRRQEVQSPSANDDTHRRQLVPNKDTHIKETHVKDTPPTGGNGVNEFVTLFKDINPSYQLFFRRPPQRAAAERLLILHTLDWWTRFMPFYLQAINDRYCPKATTPIQMEEKMAAIELYGRSKKNEKLSKSNNIAFT